MPWQFEFGPAQLADAACSAIHRQIRRPSRLHQTLDIKLLAYVEYLSLHMLHWRCQAAALAWPSLQQYVLHPDSHAGGCKALCSLSLNKQDEPLAVCVPALSADPYTQASAPSSTLTATSIQAALLLIWPQVGRYSCTLHQ